jgi:NitT/TauT family transport system substrate-binding protein
MFRIRAAGGLLLAGLLGACGGGSAAPASSTAPAPASAAASAKPATSAPASAAGSAAVKPAGSAGASASAKPGASGAASAAAKPSASGPLTKVSVGVVASSSDGGIFIAQDRGYFKDQGIEVDTQRFNTLVDMVAPVGAGQLDIAAGGLAAGLYNAIGRDVQVRIVADKGSAPSPQWDFAALMLRKDVADKVKDYKDLKGLTLVTSGKGNSPEVALATALKKGGLTLKDINFQQMGFPDMVTAMANKGIDGGIVIEPFVSSIEAKGDGVRWKGNLDIFGHNEQIAVIAYGQKLFGNQDLGRRWMTAYIKGLRDYNDAFGPKKKGYDDVVNVLVKNTSVKDPKIYAQMKPAGLDPNGKLDVASMQEDIDYYVQAGYMKEKPDLAKLVDPSFQEYAVQQLGPYQP